MHAGKCADDIVLSRRHQVWSEVVYCDDCNRAKVEREGGREGGRGEGEERERERERRRERLEEGR